MTKEPWKIRPTRSREKPTGFEPRPRGSSLSTRSESTKLPTFLEKYFFQKVTFVLLKNALQSLAGST